MDEDPTKHVGRQPNAPATDVSGADDLHHRM